MTLALMLTASVLQPVVGMITDRRPAPLALVVGMSFTLAGLLLLAFAWTYPLLLLAAALVGVGSSVFHPESSRVARMASGGQHGLAQSIFQVGGNAGSAIGPLLAAFLIAPYGQRSIIWCTLLAVAGIILTFRIGTLAACAPASHVEGRNGRRTQSAAPASAHRAAARGWRHRHPRGADLLEVFLPREPDQLLHVLSDHQVPRLGAERAAAPLPLSRRRRRRNDPRRPDWRSNRPQAGHLGLDPRRAPVLTAAAARQSLLDRGARRRDWADSGVRLLGDCRLRAGAHAGPGRADLWRVLRLRLRHGRHGCRRSRRARRPHRHRGRLRAFARFCRRSACWRRSCQTSITGTRVRRRCGAASLTSVSAPGIRRLPPPRRCALLGVAAVCAQPLTVHVDGGPCAASTRGL